MKILCFGKHGLLSTELQKWLPELSAEELIFLDRSDCDITNENNIKIIIEKHQPTIVINAVAYTKVDQCEDEEALATEVNGKSLTYIVEAVNEINATLVHFSTDYVFDGQKIGPYEEDDPTNPISAYGRSKLLGETIIKERAKKFYIMRVQWVFGPAKGNFIDTMLKLAENRDELNVVNDQVGSPTSTTSISKAVVNLLHNMPEFGIYHFRTLNHCSWYDYAAYIFEKQGLQVKVNPVPSTEFKTKAERPKNSVLNIAKWIYADLYTPLNWQRDVDEYLSTLSLAEKH